MVVTERSRILSGEFNEWLELWRQLCVRITSGSGLEKFQRLMFVTRTVQYRSKTRWKGEFVWRGYRKTAEQLKQKNKEAYEVICSVNQLIWHLQSLNLLFNLFITHFGLECRGIRRPVGGMRFFSYLKRPDRLWGPPSLQFYGCRGSSRNYSSRGVKLASHLHPVLG